MAFRGTANLGNFKDDLLTDGLTSYDNFLPSIETAYSFIQAKEPGYKIYTDGHSLGGEFAQNFAMLENLDGFGQNSLPVTSGDGIDVLAYQGSGNKFVETNVVGDPATLWYSYVKDGLYLDANPTNLPSLFPALEVLGMTAAAVSGPVGVAAAGAAFYFAHSINTLDWLASGYDLNPETSHLNVSSSPNISTKAIVWFVESLSQIASVADNGDGTFSVADYWDNHTTVTASGLDSGDGRSATLSETLVSSVIGERGISGTQTVSMTSSDPNNPVYSVTETESQPYESEHLSYTYNADGSFSGAYNQVGIAYEPTYTLSLADASTGVLVGNGGDGPGGMLGYSYTYNPDGTSSGSLNGGGSSGTVTGQFSIASDNTAKWDESVADGSGYTYTDDWSLPVGGGYDEQYADNSGSSWEYAQNSDGVETV